MQLMNVMTAVATATPAPSHFSGDPKTLSSGSAGALPARSGQETQYAAVLLASLTLYVVSLPCPVTGRSPP